MRISRRRFSLLDSFKPFKQNGKAFLRSLGLPRRQRVQALFPCAAAQVQQPLRHVDALRRKAADIGSPVSRVLPPLDEPALNKAVDHACGAGKRCSQLVCDDSHPAIAMAAQREERPQLGHRELDGEPIIGNRRPEQAEDVFQIANEALGGAGGLSFRSRMFTRL